MITEQEILELIAKGDASALYSALQNQFLFCFDLTGIRTTSVADLNMFKIDKYFEKYGLKLSEESDAEKVNILKNADILSAAGEMTIAGALIFGINPPKHLHQTGISFARFRGQEIDSELIDKREIEGNLDNIIDDAVAMIQNNIPVPSDIIGTKRIDTNPTWSAKVFREVIANAVIHRNYSIIGSKIRVLMFADRIEIISPGRLPNTVTIEKLKVGVSYSINPVIVKFMENLGYIDRLGRGIPMVYRESKIIGKKLDMKELGEEFKVTLEL